MNFGFPNAGIDAFAHESNAVRTYAVHTLRRFDAQTAAEAFEPLAHALAEGDEETAYRVHFPIASLVAIQMQAGLDGFLAVEKYLLHKRGIISTTTRRRPYYWEMDPETTAEVDRLFERLMSVVQ